MLSTPNKQFSIEVTSDSTTVAPPLLSTTTKKLFIPPWKVPETKAPMVFPTCPPSCNKEMSRFNLDGSLKDLGSYGFWVEMCGKLFLFGRRFVNWEQNVEECCKIGMTPIDLELATDVKCINSLIGDDDYRNRFSRYYWTFGLRKTEEVVSSYYWCSSGANITRNWGSGGEPNYVKNASENCVRMEFGRATNMLYLLDSNCGLVSGLSCQGPIIPKTCDSPVCPVYTCRKRDALFKTLADKATKVLIDPSKSGIWVTNDTRLFMISYPSDTKTFVESLAACCAVGLKLLSLHQEVMYSILVGAFNNASIRGEKFWTAATDQGCKKNFGFCSTNRLVRDNARWASEQPDLSTSNGTCLAVSSDGLLHDELCNTKMRYVCEGRAQIPSLLDAVERECAAEFKLTRSEVKALFNSTPDELREKCFLKCYGEGTGLFIDGNLAMDSIFAAFQRITFDDTKRLLDMYSAMDYCTNSSKGMDECDKCGSLLNCGQENSPEEFEEFVETVQLTITESPLILPPVKGVCPEYECIKKPDQVKLLATAKNFTRFIGQAVVLPFVLQLTVVCNKKFYVFATNVERTLSRNLAFCCDRGYRMATIDTKEKYDCMVQNRITTFLNLPPGTTFAVGATRLGKLDRPSWCYSDTEFDFNLAEDFVSNDTLETNYGIAISFEPPLIMKAYETSLHVVCEK
ncbi:uncharacterized protein LOC135936163 [Cloeon dipterum]|uniref:uncharacterized protein LOC135936163 n=1 Tax=Cloeon dipterum TaxID=197152 RepID=UPI00321FD2AF